MFSLYQKHRHDKHRLLRKACVHQKVAVVPGDAFGECGEGYVRVSYAYSLNHLREAIKRIGEFLEDIKNGNVQ